MKTIEERLDEYIQFADATKKYSDAGFYGEVVKHIEGLDKEIGELRELLAAAYIKLPTGASR